MVKIIASQEEDYIARIKIRPGRFCNQQISDSP